MPPTPRPLSSLLLVAIVGLGSASTAFLANPAVAGSDWWRAAQERIASDEYVLAASQAGLEAGWSAPNRAQGLRSRWQDGTLVIHPRSGEEDWQFDFRILEASRTTIAGLEYSPPRDETVDGERITWDRGWGLEIYENLPEGLKQSFQVNERLVGDGPLVLAGEVSGLQGSVQADGQEIVFRKSDGAVVLREWALVVKDVPAL